MDEAAKEAVVVEDGVEDHLDVVEEEEADIGRIRALPEVVVLVVVLRPS